MWKYFTIHSKAMIDEKIYSIIKANIANNQENVKHYKEIFSLSDFYYEFHDDEITDVREIAIYL